MNIRQVLGRMWGQKKCAEESFRQFTGFTKEINWDLLHQFSNSECRRKYGLVPLDVSELDGKVPYWYGLKIYRDDVPKTDPLNALYMIHLRARELYRYPVFAEHFKEGGVIYIPSYFGPTIDAMFFTDEYIDKYM